MKGDAPPKFLLKTNLRALLALALRLQVSGKSFLNCPRSKGAAMILSVLHHRKELNTRCSICGWDVTLELSKTDEEGKAVHEC